MTTYGTLTYDAQGRRWVIEATPDVIMRVHRIFPRMHRASPRMLQARVTPDLSADIEWLMVRYPLRCDPTVTERLTAMADAHRASQDRLFEMDRNPPRSTAFALALPLRDYQAHATSLYLEQGHLLIGDVVGLGKSACAIASFTDTRTLPALVVVKAHLPMQWRDEILKFIPAARVHIIKKGTPYELPPADVYVITYHKLSGWWGDLAKIVRSVVFDEMQELRLQGSQKYRAARDLIESVPFRLGLSATPIHNYGGEIWSIYNLLAPDALGTEQEFTREWCGYTYGGQSTVINPDALGHYLRNQHLFVRRTRSEVGRELPAITRFVQEVPYDERAYEKAITSADELARVILSGTFLERGQAAREFDVKLRQATGIAKAPFVADLVRMLVESGEKVLLGGWHRAVYDVWRDRLGDLRPVFFTGEETAAQKEDSRQRFIKGDSNVLIMSNRSGAGINGLQDVCSCCVLGELDWTPAVHEQFIGRLARDGQESPVQVFIPVIPVGCDPTMATVLGLKRAQATGIVDLGANIEEGRDFTETDPQRIRQLAREFLQARGQHVADLQLEGATS